MYWQLTDSLLLHGHCHQEENSNDYPEEASKAGGAPF